MDMEHSPEMACENFAPGPQTPSRTRCCVPDIPSLSPPGAQAVHSFRADSLLARELQQRTTLQDNAGSGARGAGLSD
jgi:hypothetical protein